MKRVLLTGSNGFIGQHLNQYFQQHSETYTIVNTYRQEQSDGNEHFIIEDINENTNWRKALKQIDIVIHLAARVHVMKEKSEDPYSDFLQTNFQATLNLANQAVQSGVKRFIYLSTIKVNGEETHTHPFSADDTPAPKDNYALSKYKAEQGLLKLGKTTGLEVIIIRPPLVYGKKVKGNMKRLIGLVKKQIPLPFNKINNQRSIVGIKNLCDFIHCCCINPRASGEVFLVKDKQDISTTKLIELIAQNSNSKVWLFFIPKILINGIAKLMGKTNQINRLWGSLQLDIEKNKVILNWEPKVSTIDGFKSMLE